MAVSSAIPLSAISSIVSLLHHLFFLIDTITSSPAIPVSYTHLPCIISLLAGALYNIVDQIFIANASYLGSYGNAANTVVFPLTVVALAIAVMIGDGCCAFVSMGCV